MISKFIKSSNTINECPIHNLPEFVFVGRSNVGKSSLINMITQNNNLTKTSSKPGKTKLMNHFLIDNKRYIIDLPGYGYAKTSNEKRKERVYNMFQILTTRKQIKNIFVLIDSKLSPQKLDISFIEELSKYNILFSIVFTKLDKISQNIFNKNYIKWQKILLDILGDLPIIFKTSSIKQKGKNEILNFIKKNLE